MYDSEFRELLDDISYCFITGDIQSWRNRIIAPFSLVTKHGAEILETEDALRENFGLYRQACTIMGLDEVYREPVSLEACPDGTWLGTYTTHLLAKGKRATAPYTATGLLHLREGRFLMSAILNARGHHEWTGSNIDHETS
ncbi:hypothetical protein AIOL_002627 [Candidatus Rhodobacter oscarellae]|uniref:SnoaL-like domain-containing protein n=1 Tax=Candidatus Rhodobacter oscarellae TaxID=1675527 RepID=A0A0J9E4K9_9RHOB|nr:hypothetical protein [Candidatus Rhodobacter lobularis]KMW57662.1 hypothetical protein AIOL_002627 [Candidatus Rhodobacter lobularis]